MGRGGGVVGVQEGWGRCGERWMRLKLKFAPDEVEMKTATAPAGRKTPEERARG